MQQQSVGAELSQAVRDNLTMINKGFVQTLSLRFHVTPAEHAHSLPMPTILRRPEG